MNALLRLNWDLEPTMDDEVGWRRGGARERTFAQKEPC
jgi:hypothetical protein